MSTTDRFTSFIIGDGSLPIQCGEILLGRGHKILGIISSDASFRDWAIEKCLAHVAPASDWLAFVSEQPFDYLFSICNLHIVPGLILAKARRAAINYHDALLPRYAGAHATSWALMNRETTHGVTWHLMTDQVDAGDILKTRSVRIADGETAFTLNAKCYEAAIASFADLTDELGEGRSFATRQNLDERTYYARNRRPAAACALSWDLTAEDIDTFVRALDFGRYQNPIGLPKLIIGSEAVTVSQVAMLGSRSGAPPGTINSVEENSLEVSTGGRDIAIHKVRTIEGRELPIADLVARFELHRGYRLTGIEQEMANRITALNTVICKHEGYWVNHLSTCEPIALGLAGPADSPLGRSQRGAVSMRVPPEVSAFAGRTRSADLIFAAFAIYLARRGGAWSFDIGFSDPQISAGLSGLESLFARHIPLRVEVDARRSVSDALDAIRGQLEVVRRRKTYARDAIARYPVLRSRPELQRNPIWPIIVEQVRRLDEHGAWSASDLALVIPEDGAECLFAFDSQTVEATAVEAMAREFEALLRLITSNPDVRILDLSLLVETDRRLLEEWNRTGADYPKNSCIHELFEAQVEHSPDAVAVVFENRRLTYRELNMRANQLAHYLRRWGVGPETPVGICVERSEQMMVGLLAVLKSGGAYVPLDPAYPRHRLAFMLRDAQVKVLLAEQQVAQALPDEALRVLFLDAEWELISRESTENPYRTVTGDNLAYVIYTSGSTGEPKGVMVEHRNVINFLTGMDRSIWDGRPGVWLAVTSISFDISVLELFWTLCRGFKVVLHRASQPVVSQGIEAGSGSSSSPDERSSLAGLIRTHNVSHLQCTPCRILALDSDALDSFGSLRKLIIGGEAFPPALARQLRKVIGGDIHNMYGLTETTVWSTTYPVSEVNETVPIGRPIANTRVYILDPELQPAPIGVPGELFVGGDGVARGYFNRPDLTAERFIKDPFSDQAGARLYRTGDIARYLPDGNIEFLGRMDNQVKIRGYRIELGEIEAVLAEHPSVRECVVIAREDVPGDKRLVGYVVLEQRTPPPDDDLRELLTERLPAHMLPTALVFLAALPRTPGGKLDRQALPAPGGSRPELEQLFEAPRDSVEEVLAFAWKRALGLERVGRHDNFFALGGDSLLAFQLTSKLRDTFRVQLPVGAFFQAPTVKGLAQLLTANEARPGQTKRIAAILKQIGALSEEKIGEMYEKSKKERMAG